MCRFLFLPDPLLAGSSGSLHGKHLETGFEEVFFLSYGWRVAHVISSPSSMRLKLFDSSFADYDACQVPSRLSALPLASQRFGPAFFSSRDETPIFSFSHTRVVLRVLLFPCTFPVFFSQLIKDRSSLNSVRTRAPQVRQRAPPPFSYDSSRPPPFSF